MFKKPLITKRKLKCDHCNRSFMLKNNLIKHISVHKAEGNVTNPDVFKCTQCNVVFAKRALLMCHFAKFHNNKSAANAIPQNFKHYCHACQLNFFHPKDLKFHIRDTHFNLVSRLPYCQFKKVNQVWFEKVSNSNSIVEIKKVAQNMLLLRKLDDNTAMKVSDQTTEVVDLHTVYPTQKNVQCHICLRVYDSLFINKHINEAHIKYNDLAMTEE